MPTILRVMLIYLVVAALSGGIAYLGNQLGRHVGRRKMSVFGMRPRHTSIFVTTVTGMMIALGTLTLAALFAKPVQLMLIGTEELERRQQGLSQQVAKLAATVASGDLIYGVDEKIFIGTIPPGIPAERIEESLLNAVAQANSLMVIKYNERAKKRDVPLVSADSVLLSYEPKDFAALVKQVRESSGVVGLRVVAGRNYLLGDSETVPVHFALFPVKLTFKAGEVVASKTVDPHSPTFLMEWYQFLEEIKIAAWNKGMLPPDSPDKMYGFELDSDGMNALIQRIEEESGPVTLQAVARKDLYESSSLDLDIGIRSDDSARDDEPVARSR